MKLKLTLASLLLSFSLANAETDYLGLKISHLYQDLKRIDDISRDIPFRDFRIDLMDRRLNHMDYPHFYFLVKNDHNGKPLYWLRYYFDEEDVQSYFKRLQRALQGRTAE